MSFDPSLLEEHYLWFPNMYKCHKYTANAKVTPRHRRIVTGTVKLVLSLLFLLLHIGYLQAVRSHIGYKANFAFTLLLCIGVLDTIQLLGHSHSALLLLTSAGNHEYGYLIGALMNGSFFVVGYLTALLPLHRLLYVVRPHDAHLIMKPFICKIVLLLFAGFLAFCVGFNLNPDICVSYIPEAGYWMTCTNRQYPILPEVQVALDQWSILGSAIIGGSIYPIIIVIVVIKRKVYMDRSTELRLTFQILAVMLVTVLAYVMWHHFLLALSISSMVADPEITVFLTTILSDLTWILYNGLNSIIYFLFNREIRSLMLRKMGIGIGIFSRNLAASSAHRQASTGSQMANVA